MSRHSGWQVPNIFPGIRSLSAPRRGRGGTTVQEIQVFIQVPITTSVQLAIASIQVDFVATEKRQNNNVNCGVSNLTKNIKRVNLDLYLSKMNYVIKVRPFYLAKSQE